MHIENDVSRKYADLEALFECKNYQELQSKIETEIGNLQSRLSDIDASHGVEANYWERIELFVKLSERCKKILKVSQEKVWEVERKIDLVAQLRDTLDKAYKNQKKYIDDTLSLYYRLTNITIEKELSNVIPNLATNLEHSMCGVFSTLMTKIVDDPYNISKIEIDIDIRKKFKKEEEVTYNRFDANLIDKLQESLKTHIQGYMNDNLAPVVETLCKELKPIQRLSDDNDQDLKRKINKQIKKIDRHISNVTAKLQTTAHHYRAILHGVSQKVNLTFACVEKGIIYERYHSKYLKDPIDSFRRVFRKPFLQHLIWEPASPQLAQVEKIFTEVYSLIQNYQHCTYSYMTTYFSYDYIKNYIQDRCKGDGGKFDGLNIDYPDFEDSPGPGEGKGFDDKTGHVAFGNFVTMLQDDLTDYTGIKILKERVLELLDNKLVLYMSEEIADPVGALSCLKKCEKVFEEIDSFFKKMGDNDVEQDDDISFMIYKVELAKEQIVAMKRKIVDSKAVILEIAPDLVILLESQISAFSELENLNDNIVSKAKSFKKNIIDSGPKVEAVKNEIKAKMEDFRNSTEVLSSEQDLRRREMELRAMALKLEQDFQIQIFNEYLSPMRTDLDELNCYVLQNKDKTDKLESEFLKVQSKFSEFLPIFNESLNMHGSNAPETQKTSEEKLEDEKKADASVRQATQWQEDKNFTLEGLNGLIRDICSIDSSIEITKNKFSRTKDVPETDLVKIVNNLKSIAKHSQDKCNQSNGDHVSSDDMEFFRYDGKDWTVTRFYDDSCIPL